MKQFQMVSVADLAGSSKPRVEKPFGPQREKTVFGVPNERYFPISEKQRRWSDCANVQASLRICCSPPPPRRQGFSRRGPFLVCL